jgi:integrase/recombinase XerD
MSEKWDRSDLEGLKLAYLQHLKLKNLAALSIRQMDQALRVFLDFIQSRGVGDVGLIDRELFEKYKAHLSEDYLTRKGKRLTTNTIRDRLFIVQRWFLFLRKKGVLFFDPIAEVRPPKIVKQLLRGVMRADEIRKVMAQPDLKIAIGYRDRTMMEILYATGVRCAELVNLRAPDVDLKKKVIRVRNGKGGKDRFVPLSTPACRFIERYLSTIRPELARCLRPAGNNWKAKSQTGEDFLFLSIYGGQISRVWIAATMKRYIAQAGITRPVSPVHSFRHSVATHLLESGMDVRYVQAFLGHESINSTQIYTHVERGTLGRLIKAHHPRALSGESVLPYIPKEDDPFTAPQDAARTEQAPEPRKGANSSPLWRRPGTVQHHAPSQELQELKDRYLAAMIAECYAEGTILHAHTCVERLYKFLSLRGVSGIAGVTPEVLDDFSRSLSAQPNAYRAGKIVGARTVHYRLFGVKLFFKWLTKNKLVPADPTASLKLPQITHGGPQTILTQEEARKLLDAPGLKYATDYRDKALMEVVYATGIRTRELMRLKVSDFDAQALTLFVRPGKTGRDRLVPLPSFVAACLREYVERVRPRLIALAVKDNGVLFVSWRGQGFDRQRVGELFKRRAQAAGITKHVTPMILRHSIDAHLTENGMDARYVETFLGHENARRAPVDARAERETLGRLIKTHHPRALSDKPIPPYIDKEETAHVLTN